MDDESGNESGSEQWLPSFGPRVFGFMMNKHRCVGCGNYVDEDKMTYRIDNTREYPDPSRFMSSAHKIWTCNECHSLTSVLDDTSSSTNLVKDSNDQAASSPTVEEASPPTKKQKQSDNDAHSDSESAK